MACFCYDMELVPILQHILQLFVFKTCIKLCPFTTSYDFGLVLSTNINDGEHFTAKKQYILISLKIVIYYLHNTQTETYDLISDARIKKNLQNDVEKHREAKIQNNICQT